MTSTQTTGQQTVYDVIYRYSNGTVKVHIPLTTEKMNTTITEALGFKFKQSSNMLDNVLKRFMNSPVARNHLQEQILELTRQNNDDFVEYKKIIDTVVSGQPAFQGNADEDYIDHLINDILTATPPTPNQIRMQAELLNIVATNP